MYMMRMVYQCQRGKCQDVVECLKIVNQIYTSDGCKNGKIYVDRMGRMDRAIYEFEIASLDQFYSVLKERYAHLSAGRQSRSIAPRLTCSKRSQPLYMRRSSAMTTSP
jgi:hypothetical protein